MKNLNFDSSKGCTINNLIACSCADFVISVSHISVYCDTKHKSYRVFQIEHFYSGFCKLCHKKIYLQIVSDLFIWMQNGRSRSKLFKVHLYRVSQVGHFYSVFWKLRHKEIYLPLSVIYLDAKTKDQDQNYPSYACTGCPKLGTFTGYLAD